MICPPEPQHHWLQKLVGDWVFEVQVPAGPDTPATTLHGTERVRPVGELWVVAEGSGPMPGGKEAFTQMTLGYDPARQGFVGTWIGSMMTHLWIYEGELDPSGTTLTLSAEGPNPETESGTGKYRDVITWLADGRRTLTSFMLLEDDSWRQLMKAEYRRTGSMA